MLYGGMILKRRNGQLFRIIYLNGKLETNRKNQVYIKVSEALIVFTVFFCALIGMCNWFVWGLSILAVITFSALNIFYIKEHKRYELELYLLDVKDLEDQKKLAEIRGEFLPDTFDNYRIKPPTEKLNLPISYFLFLMIAEILIGILLV